MGSAWQMYAGPASDDDEPGDFKRPAWLGPPENELGRAVDVARVVAQSGRGAVALTYVLAYSTGLSLNVLARVGGLKRGEMHMIHSQQHIGRVSDPEELPEGTLRLGLDLPDGGRVSNFAWRGFAPDQEPKGPVLTPSGGGGGVSSDRHIELHLGYWLWPLPGDGTLTLHCEWPIAEIPFTSVELETAPLREAASRALKL